MNDHDTDGLYSYCTQLDAVLDQAVADQTIFDRHPTGNRGVSPLDAFIRDVAVIRRDAIRFRDHSCVWSLDGYCTTCGRVRIGH